MPTRTLREQGYGPAHRLTRRAWAADVARGGVACARCGEMIEPGEPWHLDHTDDRTGYLGPSHALCNTTATAANRPGKTLVDEDPAGYPASSPVWDVPWLDDLRDLPAEATWPRLMTPPHPQAAGSLGGEFIAAARARSGAELRWWQRLTSTRLLEVDAAGVLVWRTLILTLARQLGKSWWLRELLLWRLQAANRFGEPQMILHTGKDLPVCRDVQRPARAWAREDPRFKVYEANGRESIEFGESRWVVKARTGVYGLSAGLAAVDEGWKVAAPAVDDGIVPTMVERAQPQLLLISTAHRAATSLMLNRRRRALQTLGAPGLDLLVEWSAPRDLDIADSAGWRLASPHWTAQREETIRDALERARAGEALDVDEPDPLEAFRAQWLNQWPLTLQRAAAAEPLLAAGVWDGLREEGLEADGPIWVAMEDDYGLGAAVACARKLPDGRLELDAVHFGNWDSAIGYVQRLGLGHRIRELCVGASLLDRLPGDLRAGAQPRVATHTRLGLALLRDLASAGGVAHDTVTGDLDAALARLMVRETASGLLLLGKGREGRPHVVKAAVWALMAAHRPAPMPAVH